MTHQLSIDSAPRARAGDKPSSHQAAAKVAAQIPERVALFCYALHRIKGYGTANEVAAHLIDTLGWVHWSTGPWKRAADCERLGLIHPYDAGTNPTTVEPVYRRCSVSGHRAMVWELKATGRDVAHLIVPLPTNYGGPFYRYEPEGKQWQT